MKDDSIEISTKHLPLRIVGFVLAFAIAVGAFVVGVNRISGNEEGFAVVSARADGDAPMYAARIRLTYNFSGRARAIRLMKNELTDAYSDALVRLYKLLDAETDYPGYAGNLADLNRHLNQEYTIPQELFDILREALELSEQGAGWSLYSAPLYAEWESIAYADDASDFDPLRNGDEAQRLSAIAARCADPEACRLEIVDAEKCIVRVHVSQEYLDFLQDHELPRTVLDLGWMKDAFLLRGTAEALNRRGFTNGFLSSVGGLTLSLSDHEDGDYVIYSYVNNNPMLAATVPAAPGTACAMFTAFPPVEGEAGFYTVDDVLRCAARPALSAEDEPPLSSVFALRRDGDIVGAAFEALCDFLRPKGEPTGTDADLLVWTRSGGDGKTLRSVGAETASLTPEPGVMLERAAGS